MPHCWKSHVTALLFINQVNPLWRLALHSSSGMMRESRWQIGDHIFDGNYSDQRYSVNWYTNLCWDEVYKNDENGIALNGYDIESLRGKASKGHRIKLMYNRTLIECTEVLLKGDHVCCTCFNKLSKSAIDEFPSDVNHIAEIVCTNGMINRLITEIGSNIVVNGTLEEHASVSWFADVRRSWRNVVSIDPTGGVISGSKQVLIDVVEGGAAIRYKVQFGPQYFAIFEPDHIEIDGENLGAMFIRSIGMRFDNDFVFKYIQERPYLSAHIMTTIGKMDKSKWTLGEHEPRGHEVEFHKADWFVNN